MGVGGSGETEECNQIIHILKQNHVSFSFNPFMPRCGKSRSKNKSFQFEAWKQRAIACSVQFEPSKVLLLQKGEYTTGVVLTCPTSVANWFIKGSALCYHVCAIMHVKDTWLSVVGLGLCFPLASVCLSLYAVCISINSDMY